jgi:Xaa-Pro dipeptidase
MMQKSTQAFTKHIDEMKTRSRDILKALSLDCLLIHAGHPVRIFLDDQTYPFKANPYFMQWLPLPNHPHCWLIVSADKRPKLIFHYPEDDPWQSTPGFPPGDWREVFDIEYLASPTQVERLLPHNLDRCAYLGPHPEIAKALGISQVNPEALLNFLDFHRAIKTDYEQQCLRAANKLAQRAHVAAKDAFFAGGSEFDVSLAYLSALGGYKLPYTHRVAFNEHAGVPHYRKLDNQSLPEKLRNSMLIEGGAEVAGYGADISRTYAYRKGVFAEMVEEVERIGLQLVDSICVGQRFTDLQFKMHHLIGKLLVDFELVNCSAAACVDVGVTAYFTPHGVGHHLGLQPHDVGGCMDNGQGSVTAPPLAYPNLRSTRVFQPGQVVTIEPGIFWNSSLLKSLASSDYSRFINWAQVDMFREFGGIRVEDDILVTQTGTDNLSRI